MPLFDMTSVQPGAVAAPPRVSGLGVGESDLVIVGLAVCWENRDSYYISLCDSQEEGELVLPVTLQLS